MGLESRIAAVLGESHPRRRLAIRDAVALGVLGAIMLVLFAITGLYYSAYSRYRSKLGLPVDNTPVITLPAVRRHG